MKNIIDQSAITPPKKPYLGEEYLRRLMRSLDEVIISVVRLNDAINVGSVTLNENEISTTITDENINVNSVINLTAKTANAALELGNGSLFVSSTGSGEFTITHDNNSQIDRTFDYMVIG